MAISNLSTGLRTGVCTSTTRPTTPYEGQHIYETDTDINYVWNGTAWLVLPPTASPTFTGTTTSGTFAQGTDYLSPYQGFRNKIINGNMSVAQRGTSTAFTATASTSFLIDRWSGYRSVAGSTQSQISSSLANFQYALRMQRNSGNTATNKIYIGQSFETSSIVTFAGKTMAVSFYARAGSNFSAASSLFTLNVFSGTGTECNVVHVTPTGLTTDLSTTFTLTTSWQRFSASYNVPSSVTQHGLQFDFLPVGTASTNDYVDITGVQLEEGSVATPFEQRPIGVELNLCFRYYQRMVDPAGSGVSTSAAKATRVLIPLYTKMRTTPTTTISGTMNFWNGGSTGGATALLGTYNSVSHAQLDFDGGIGSAGQAVSLYTTGGSQYLDFSAEL